LASCEGLNDSLLHKWLNKCGSAIRKLDISWCAKLTSQAVDIIVQYCSVLEDLLMIKHSTSIDEIEDCTSDIQKICTKYRNQLKNFQFSGINETGLGIIGDTLSSSLTSFAMPFSLVGDNAVQLFVTKCPQLDQLGLEMCKNISPELVKQLRTNLQVTASHTPEDFAVELSLGDEDDTVISIRLKAWSEDIDVLQTVRPILPEGISEHTDVLRCNAEASQVFQLFSKAGFDDITIKEDSDDSGDEMIPCTTCKEQCLEEELLICDECESGYHPECINPPLKELLPEEDYWICENCKGDKSNEEELDGHSRKKAQSLIIIVHNNSQ